MKRRLLTGIGIALGALVVLAGAALLAIDRSGYHYRDADFAYSGGDKAARRKLEASFTRPPAKVYIVVDRTHNRLELRKGSTTTLTAVCSAGSGYKLVERDTAKRKGRQWVFDTPRGIHKVKNKRTDPVWKRPDWDYIERGEAIPRRDSERIEYGMLGDYALDLGDGYMIHGTLYERLLGRGVTHGCIRLGKDDLATVYRESPLGTPVYIY